VARSTSTRPTRSWSPAARDHPVSTPDVDPRSERPDGGSGGDDSDCLYGTQHADVGFVAADAGESAAAVAETGEMSPARVYQLRDGKR